MSQTVPMILKNNLKYWRENNNLSQTDLAERANVTQSYISQIESGRLMPSVVRLSRISEALNCNVDDLIDNWSKSRPRFPRRFHLKLSRRINIRGKKC